MALEKASASLPFVQGVDSRTDPKLSAKPALLYNGVFRRKTLTKRAGRAAMTRSTLSGGTLSGGQLISAYDETLLWLSSGLAFSWAETPNRWVPLNDTAYQGVLQTGVLAARGLATPSDFVYGADWAIVNGMLVVAYGTSDGINVRWYVDVYDAATLTLYNSTVTTSVGGETGMRCVALRDSVLVIAKFGNAMYRAVVNTASPTTAASFATFGAVAYAPASGAAWDAIAYTPELAVIVYPTNGTDLRFTGMDQAGAVTATPAATTVAGVTAANGLQAGICVAKSAADQIFVVYGNSAAGSTQYLVRDGSFGLVLGPTNVVTTGNWSGLTAEMRKAVGWQSSATSMAFCMNGTSDAQWLGYFTCTNGAVLSAFSELGSTQRLSIVSGIGMQLSPEEPLVACVQRGDLTPAIHIVNAATGTVRATGLIWDAGGLVNQVGGRYHRIPSRAILTDGGTKLNFLVFQRGRSAYASFAGGVIDITPQGATQLTLAQTSAAQLPGDRLGETVYYPGAFPRCYDGKALIPNNFVTYPLLSAAANGGAGAVDAGVHQYKFVWAWVNHRGELVRSPASTATSHTANGTGVILDIYTMPGSIRDLMQDGIQVYLETYRTKAGQTIFYRSQMTGIAPQILYYNAVAYSGTTAGFIQITDGVSDAVLGTGEILYASAGVLDWQAPPAHSFSFVHQRRLVCCGLENPYAWIASSGYVDGETVRFNQLLASAVPADTGPIVGGASLDAKLVLFTTQAAYFTLGEGPDLLGNNPYPAVQRIQSVDGGVVSPMSIVETPMGVMYQSQKGIMLLDRGLNTNFIGQDVVAWSTGNWVVSSVVLDTTNYEVRFLANSGSDLVGSLSASGFNTNNGGVALVYNYLENQWSVFDDYGGQASLFWEGTYTMLRSDGLVRTELENSWRDDGAYYPLLVETAWLKPAQVLSGFGRLWYVEILGTYNSDCTIELDVAFDFDGSSPDVPEWTTEVSLDGYGVYELEGPFKVRHHVGHKAQAYKFRISESDIRGTGKGLSLTELAIEYGVKRGLFKLAAEKTL